jgi:hypothetical protein
VRVSKHRHLGFRHLGLQDLGVPDLGVPDLGVPDLGTWDHGDRHITLLHLSIGNPILQIEIHLLPPGAVFVHFMSAEILPWNFFHTAEIKINV